MNLHARHCRNSNNTSRGTWTDSTSPNSITDQTRAPRFRMIHDTRSFSFGPAHVLPNRSGTPGHTDFGAPYHPSFSLPRRKRSFAHLCAAYNYIETKRFDREETLLSTDRGRRKRSDARRGWSHDEPSIDDRSKVATGFGAQPTAESGSDPPD